MSRSYGLNSDDKWQHAVEHCVHHLATDKVNEKRGPWSRTRNREGWPFELIEGTIPSLSEQVEIEGIEVESGDVWGRSDSGFFYYKRFTPSSADQRHRGFIASPGSHVPEWAKGALVARASLEADAAFFSVVRVSRDHALRVQFRRTRGATAEDSTRPVCGEHRIDADTLIFVRLEISDRGRTARAWGSATGRWDEWVLIDRHTFEEPLIYQGFCASSRDQAIRFLFGSLRDPFPFHRSKVLGDTEAHGRHFHGVMG